MGGSEGPFFAHRSSLGGNFRICLDLLTYPKTAGCFVLHVRDQLMNIGELSWEALTGYRSAGHKGTVDLLLYKREMLQYLLNVFAVKNPFDANVVAKLREIFTNHTSYRTTCGAPMARVPSARPTKNLVPECRC